MCSFSGYLWWLSSFSCRLALVNRTDGTIKRIRCLSTSHPGLKAVTSKRLLAPVLPIWYTCVQRYIIKRVRVSVLYNFYTFSLVVERTHPTVLRLRSVRRAWFKKNDTILSGEYDSRNIIQFCWERDSRNMIQFCSRHLKCGFCQRRVQFLRPKVADVAKWPGSRSH